MNKRTVLLINAALLTWFFLDMTGLRIGDRLIVSRAYKEDGVFFIIYVLLVCLFVFKDRIGSLILTVWLFLWFSTQFASHWYVTVFGPSEDKIDYFSDTVKIIHSNELYIPDLYHVVLHLMIAWAFIAGLHYHLSLKARKF
ncbi:MAG: hypothetical protein ACQEQA_01760 [Bacillota bacterium]